MPAGAAERRHHEQAGPTARRDEEHGFPPAHRASSRGYATLVTSEIKLWSQVLGIFFGASIVLVVYSGRMAKSIAYGARSASSSFATPARPRPDLDDSPETFARWSARHQANVKEAEQLGPRIDLTFLGDSITEGWLRHPLGHHSHDGNSPEPVRDTFEREFGGWGEVTDWGIGGDRVEDLHWRLLNGLLDSAWRPRAIVCLIGTNNLKDPKVSPERVSGQVAEVARLIVQRFPHTKLLLLGIFPRAQRPWDPPADPHASFVSFETLPRFSPWNASNPYFAKIGKINKLLEKAAGSAGGNVRFLDCSPELLRPFSPDAPPGAPPLTGPPLSDGDRAGVDWVDREIFGDYLHLTPEGYKRWAACLRPVLSEWRDWVLPPLESAAPSSAVIAAIDDDTVPLLHADHSIIENGRRRLHGDEQQHQQQPPTTAAAATAAGAGSLASSG